MPRHLILALILALALLAAPVHAVYPGDPGYRGCVMLTQDGQFDDTDCDKVPDIADDCPLTHNNDQSDVDRNGIGDACDILITKVLIEPQTPMQGRSVVSTIAIMNNRAYPLNDLDVKIEVPRLGLYATDRIAKIDPGRTASVELVTRLPECAPTQLTDIIATLEHTYGPRQVEVFSQAVRVPVVPGGVCAQTNPNGDRTIVDILDSQDVNADEGALYPFTIRNNEAESRAYVLSISGIDAWGSAEVYPGAVVVVPAGEARDGSIRVWSRPGWSGRQSFTFSVQARDDAKQMLLTADITPAPQLVGQSGTPGALLLRGLLAFLLVLLIVGIVIYALRHRRHHDAPEPPRRKR